MSRAAYYALTGVGALALIAGSFWLGGAVYSRTRDAQVEPQTPQEELAQAAETFALSASPDTRLAQMRTVKAIYMATTSAVIEARALNEMVGFVHAAHEPYLYDELFNGPPLAKFKIENDEQRSLAALADYSYSIYPTTYAAQIPEQVDSIALFAQLKQSKTPQTRATVAAITGRILARYAKANQTIGTDLEGASSPFEAAGILVGFYQWQAHLLGDVSFTDPSYLAPALENLSLGLALARSSDAQYHTDDFEEMVASMLYSYAKYAQAGGPAYASVVRQNADAFAAMLKTHPERHARFFIMFAEVRDMQQHMGNMESEHQELMEEVLARVSSMARLSQSLRDLLTRQGITIQG